MTEKLNEQQLAAVTAQDGPSLVLAGAGTGKTRVIVERLAWLVEEKGVDPRNLLALTFTNKAAAEMRERFSRRIAVERLSAWLGTFHSFGLFILRREMERLGRPKVFTIFDDADQLSLMKRLIKEMPEHMRLMTPREALSWLSRLKQDCEKPDPEAAAGDPAEEGLLHLWNRYHASLLQAGGVDFDDLLVLMVRLFQEHPDVCAKYQQRYKYIVVDEYQDTNRAQYLITKLLSEGHGNLFVVGDEDQSIYSWRGADINNILDFAEDFPQALVHRLEINYRSTKPILAAANALVAKNVNRLGKTLKAAATGGEPVRLQISESGEGEAEWIANDIQKRSLEPRETAILYRTNSQSRHIEESFLKKGINYTVVGGIKFYARKEIKDIIAYLRLLVNPGDDESLRRVLNVPPRGIGGVTLQRFEEYASARRTALLQVLRDVEMDETVSARARRSAFEFVNMVDDLAVEAKTSKVKPLVEMLLSRIGYREFVRESDEKDFRARIEIIDEFVASCAQYDAGKQSTLLDFLQELALVSDVDSYEADAPAVTLMTCHSAKGLEFDHVYLVGLEEGLLPLIRDFDDTGDVEEERRLCYVAMTRARKTLSLTAARSRVLYGTRRDDRSMSRFLSEIGPEHLVEDKYEPKAPKPKGAPSAAGLAGVTLKMGTRVRHAKFGPGVVQYTTGQGDKLRARIRFNTGRSAMLMVSQAPLEIVEGK